MLQPVAGVWLRCCVINVNQRPVRYPFKINWLSLSWCNWLFCVYVCVCVNECVKKDGEMRRRMMMIKKKKKMQLRKELYCTQRVKF